MKPPLEITDWKIIEYPIKNFGSAQIKNCRYKKGIYLMEGVDGYLLFKVKKAITVQELQIDGNVWMVDDPCHWIGMKRLAEHSKGKVLVGGLGMGLLVHHLLANEEVSQIDVVDTNKDVIGLVSPLFNDKRLTIYNDNVKSPKWLRMGGYDTIIMDIWVYGHDQDPDGTGRLRVWAETQTAIMSFERAYPQANVFVWGLRDTKHNPAVVPIEEKYLELLREM